VSTFDAAYHEDLCGRVRGVLIAVVPQLSRETASLVDELIDANECGEALEILAEMLAESGAQVSDEIINDVAQLSSTMGLGTGPADRLRADSSVTNE
jgi:hypothetical protein